MLFKCNIEEKGREKKVWEGGGTLEALIIKNLPKSNIKI
jgi:hypothetical protein